MFPQNETQSFSEPLESIILVGESAAKICLRSCSASSTPKRDLILPVVDAGLRSCERTVSPRTPKPSAGGKAECVPTKRVSCLVFIQKPCTFVSRRPRAHPQSMRARISFLNSGQDPHFPSRSTSSSPPCPISLRSLSAYSNLFPRSRKSPNKLRGVGRGKVERQHTRRGGQEPRGSDCPIPLVGGARG